MVNYIGEPLHSNYPEQPARNIPVNMKLGDAEEWSQCKKFVMKVGYSLLRIVGNSGQDGWPIALAAGTGNRWGVQQWD